MTTLNHYTITTGHNRVSPRSEVSDAAIAVCLPMLTDGEHAIPGVSGYMARVHPAVVLHGSRARDAPCAGALSATIWRLATPLVDVYVARDADSLAAIVAATGAVPPMPLSAPAVLVELFSGSSGDPALDWLADFERCLAWAWIEQGRE